jgi:hypothetical protein
MWFLWGTNWIFILIPFYLQAVQILWNYYYYRHEEECSIAHLHINRFKAPCASFIASIMQYSLQSVIFPLCVFFPSTIYLHNQISVWVWVWHFSQNVCIKVLYSDINSKYIPFQRNSKCAGQADWFSYLSLFPVLSNVNLYIGYHWGFNNITHHHYENFKVLAW